MKTLFISIAKRNGGLERSRLLKISRFRGFSFRIAFGNGCCAAAIFAMLAVCGCASVKTMHVDAIASPNAACGKACAIVPANPKISTNDLRFKETSDIVAKALGARGFSFVADSSKADVVLAVDASLGTPENVAVARVDSPFPDPGFYGACRVPVRGRDGGVCYVRAAMWYPAYPWPERGDVTIYRDTIYEKRLALTAYLNNGDKAGDLPQLWSVLVTSRDNSGDLRAYLPAMALAASRFAGGDTKGRTVVDIFDDDPELAGHSPASSDSEPAFSGKGDGKTVGGNGKYLIDETR